MILAAGLQASQPRPAAAVSLVSSVTIGGGHSCVIMPDGGVQCWGLNNQGQLGDGTTANSSAPVDVIGVSDAVVMSAGTASNCVVNGTGAVKCWGHGSTAAAVAGLESGIAEVASGFRHDCVRTTTGGAQCWGWNSDGQLGDGSGVDSATPVDVLGLGSGVLAVSTGDFHSCAIAAGGGVQCWGRNASGQLGDGTIVNGDSPVDVQGLGSGIIQITTGGAHSCALNDAGGLICWGDNTYGGLGDGTTTDRTTPVSVVGLASGVSAVSASVAGHTCALMDTGRVKCWGVNVFGAVGDGNVSVAVLEPVDVIYGGNNVDQVSAGGSATCTLSAGATVTCWGDNLVSQLGDSDGDGCTDVTEAGLNPELGGQRDPTSIWDFFDVWTHPSGQPTVWVRDKVINIPGDLFGVAGRFGANDAGPGTFDRNSDPLSPPNVATGDPREDYHPSFDRSASIGPNVWDNGPPDGAINLVDDILGVAAQFGHTC